MVPQHRLLGGRGEQPVPGGGLAVHYPSEYREFDGIMVPTRRRVYVRNPDGSPLLNSVSSAGELGGR